MTPSTKYLIDNRQAQAGQRFDALLVPVNPDTFRHTRMPGLEAGWRVREVRAVAPIDFARAGAESR